MATTTIESLVHDYQTALNFQGLEEGREATTRLYAAARDAIRERNDLRRAATLLLGYDEYDLQDYTDARDALRALLR